MKKTIAKVLRIISVALSLALLAVFLLRIIDAYVPFISKVEVLGKIVSYALTYGFLLLASLVAVSAALNKSWILAIIVLLAVAVIVVFSFFPGVLEQIGL